MSRQKIKIGITGGIGSGKSYVCRLLEQQGVPVFDCDINARNEMLENQELQEKLRRFVSPEIFNKEGQLNKPVIRRFLHSSLENAIRFDELVHPYVRIRWRRWADTQTADCIAMECALLFEAAFDNEVNIKIIVTAPKQERISRVMKRDGTDAASVRQWMKMQLADMEKIKLSDFIIVNDGILDTEKQISAILEKIRI